MNKSYIGVIEPGLISSIVRTVNRYTVHGPIGRGDLVHAIKVAGHKTDERTVREAIKTARRMGQLICSAAGTNGGYYMARDMDEYKDFKAREFMAKVTDMLETVRAMDRSAEREFGSLQQTGLF